MRDVIIKTFFPPDGNTLPTSEPFRDTGQELSDTDSHEYTRITDVPDSVSDQQACHLHENTAFLHRTPTVPFVMLGEGLIIRQRLAR